ncbi:MAG TPA: TPM domain-containing protein, partial [Deltaproteobacteria bacterium]|nr:TPM domain-containing protein [Deltaproteobacteria bacterium]
MLQTEPLHADTGSPSDYVVDTAGVIDKGARSRLNSLLMELEQKTGAQFVVLTVPSTGGVPIEEYAIARAQGWGLGRKGKDDGLLLVIAVNDRKYRFETGYGLESTLPDSFLGSVGRGAMVPAFRKGDYTGGIETAVVIVCRQIAKARRVELSGIPKTEARKTRSSPLGPFLAFLAIAFLLSLAAGRHRRGGLVEAVILGSLLSGRHHGGPGGFGSFGGGFGSFGGGGGGSFGGGGASGGW